MNLDIAVDIICYIVLNIRAKNVITVLLRYKLQLGIYTTYYHPSNKDT